MACGRNADPVTHAVDWTKRRRDKVGELIGEHWIHLERPRRDRVWLAP
jgi:hypothetical protein